MKKKKQIEQHRNFLRRCRREYIADMNKYRKTDKKFSKHCEGLAIIESVKIEILNWVLKSKIK